VSLPETPLPNILEPPNNNLSKFTTDSKYDNKKLPSIELDCGVMTLCQCDCDKCGEEAPALTEVFGSVDDCPWTRHLRTKVVTAERNVSRNTSEIESQLVRDGAVPATPALVGLFAVWYSRHQI
jgi:hypothetical protein